MSTPFEYGRDDPEIDTLGESRRRLRLLAFPRGRSASHFNEGERLRSSETRGGWRLRIRGEIRRRYRLQASLRSLRRRLSPCVVRVDGHELPRRRWSFDRRTKVLSARLVGRRVDLQVPRNGCR